MYVVVPCSQNFSPTLPPTLVGELFIHEFFNDYNEDMVTFTALTKIYIPPNISAVQAYM